MTDLILICIPNTLQQWHLTKASNSTLPKFLLSGLALGKMKMPRRQQSLLPSRLDIATLTLQDGRYWASYVHQLWLTILAMAPS